MLGKILGCSLVLSGLMLAAPAHANEAAEKLAKQNACTACHGIDNKIVGPAYKDVAAKYADDPEGLAKVKDSIKNGGKGKWGQIPMPAQPQLSDEQVTLLAEWILGLK
ncbi:c-type cytochrome [Pseudidiomarina terrestris]|uniref:Cytochrome c-551 n=1 Tax=Pseudidiomarina terrestris TaxID=2820060 RepID=A0AAW7R203_9GAMM|nr:MULTISPECIES: c-type cytochrome [unclassified Pseudidiomarina]MDN7124645.1 c-type cytochrome [Pseudidiomarina sp. 1APP75-32.1]MDN7126809.1 c-type cytochrome [Pseudidiomarina sp. 1APR75-33.1]MDN7129064.1 c-type cytochrome [Pseudidiomarina sp. 1APR75-15]MDN7134672.1 c-type cytochrome [Pseudidiomarina sp. 1ASP75-5]MDN7136658.1 c-type cytochrome [Pseudidiomarina sp. 1ASP75-14]